MHQSYTPSRETRPPFQKAKNQIDALIGKSRLGHILKLNTKKEPHICSSFSIMVHKEHSVFLYNITLCDKRYIPK